MSTTTPIKDETFARLLQGLGQVRWLALVAIIWFLVFFNLERIDYQNEPLVNFSNSTYLTALLTALVFLIFPTLESLPWLWQVGGVYVVFVALSLLFTPDRLLVLDTDLVSDLLALFVTLEVMRRVSRLLEYYELSTRAFVFEKERSRVQPLKDLQPLIHEELIRNQHFGHPMAVIYFQVYYASNPFGTAVHQILDNNVTLPLERRYNQVLLGNVIGDLVYSSDFVAEYGDDIVVFLPENDRASAEHFTHLVRRFIKHQYDLQIRAGIALSSEDGHHVDDLVREAQQRVQILMSQEAGTTTSSQRMGDVLLELDQLIKIQTSAEWVNRMPYPSPLERQLYRPLKRLMDVSAIVLISPILVPLLSLLALAIYLDDRGPIFYMQDRTGLGGKRFKMFKFRSMKVNADVMPAKRIELPNGEVRYEWPEKTDYDPRVTRVGRITRKTSLDELPQLLNILRGDMSLVGPRPTTWDVNMYTLHQTERLTVRPGLTGLWQVSARESKNFDERLVWDKKYVDKLSLTLDLMILWKTVAQVLKKGGV